MKKVLFIASESVPFIKTGGLADVVGSLPKCIDKEYFDVRVFLPRYLCMKPEFEEALQNIPYPGLIESYNTDFRFAEEMFDQYSNMKRVPVYEINENGLDKLTLSRHSYSFVPLCVT